MKNKNWLINIAEGDHFQLWSLCGGVDVGGDADGAPVDGGDVVAADVGGVGAVDVVGSPRGIFCAGVAAGGSGVSTAAGASVADGVRGGDWAGGVHRSDGAGRIY